MLVPLLQHLPRAEGDLDDSGNFTTTNWLIPEQAELIYGGIASAIIIAVLVWKAGPMARKAFRDRSERVEQELEESAQDQAQAEAKASQVRTALGDIESERRRILSEADTQAESLLADGRARLAAEISELEAKAESDIAAGRERVTDELRGGDRALRHRRRRAGRRALARRFGPATADRGLHPAGRPAAGAGGSAMNGQIELVAVRASERQRASGQQRPAWPGNAMNGNDRVDGYARGLFEVARAEGTLDEVEDELFRFARSYESSDELRNALSDDQIPPGKRQAIVEDLLGGKATPTTVQLVSMVIGSGRSRELPAIIDRMVQRAAQSKDLALAEVRSAIPLTADQQDRLKAALANATGKTVELKVIVDPSVLGGLVATVGDKVIDDTVRSRLDQLKSRL